MKSYFLFWKRMFDVKGVTSRSQYWTSVLVNFAVILNLNLAFMAIEERFYEQHKWDMAHTMEAVSPWILGVFCLFIFIGSITLTVRRLHDHNNSGLLYLINFIPVIGSLIILIFMCLGTVKNDNPWRRNDIQRGLLPEDKENPLGDWEYEDIVYHMEYREKNPEEDI